MQDEIARHLGEDGGSGSGDPMDGVLEDLVDTMRRLSLGVARKRGDEDLHEALSALGLTPGDIPPSGSADAAKPWLDVEDDLEEIMRRGFQEEIMGEGAVESPSEDE